MDFMTIGAANVQAKKYINAKISEMGLEGVDYYFCSSGEYNTTTGVPTVSSPGADVLYLVPSVSNDNEVNVYNYKNNQWVLFNTLSLEPENFVVDDTLSNSGQAADAKKVGDEIGNVKDALDDINKIAWDGYIPITSSDLESGAITNAGVNSDNSTRIRTAGYIPIKAGAKIYFTPGTNIQSYAYNLYNKAKVHQGQYAWFVTDENIAIDGYIRFVFRKGNGTADVSVSDYDASVRIISSERSIVEAVSNDLESLSPIKIQGFSTEQNLLPFCKALTGKFVYTNNGNIYISNSASYTTYIIPIEQKTYYLTQTSWWAIVDASGGLLGGCGLNGTSITSIDISDYATAAYFYYSTSSDAPYFSQTNGGSELKWTLEGLETSVEVPNNNVFDIPNFKYITGKEWNLYFSGGWLRNAEYKRASNGIGQYIDHFSYMVSGAGYANSTIQLYDNDFDLIGTKQFTIQYVSPSYRDVIALFIGDSTINNGSLTNKVLDTFAANSVTCTLLGTRGDGLNKHEGRSGWTANDYCGETTRGQDTAQNPFYNPTSEEFDFSYYMTNQGYSAPDFVFIQLGINDMFSVSMAGFENGYNTFKTNMLNIIDSIHAYSADIKIVVNLILMPNENVSAYNTLYGTRYYNWERRYVDILTNYNLINDLPAYVLKCPHNLILDPNTMITDDVHPTSDGYTVLGTFDAEYMFAN